MSIVVGSIDDLDCEHVTLALGLFVHTTRAPGVHAGIATTCGGVEDAGFALVTLVTADGTALAELEGSGAMLTSVARGADRRHATIEAAKRTKRAARVNGRPIAYILAYSRDMRSPARRLAAPFVATMTLAACTKNGDGSKITGDPGNPSASTSASIAPTPSTTTAALPPAPTDVLVYKNWDGCRTAPVGVQVQCPDGGPTAILADVDSVKDGDGSIELGKPSLKCFRRPPPIKCPPGVSCNPPAMETVPCPAALMPKLAAGLQPTKRDGARCWFGAVEVACPVVVVAAPGDCPTSRPVSGDACSKVGITCKYAQKPAEGPSVVQCTCVTTTSTQWQCGADPTAPIYKE
jgi:hypothetical protein